MGRWRWLLVIGRWFEGANFGQWFKQGYFWAMVQGGLLPSDGTKAATIWTAVWKFLF